MKNYGITISLTVLLVQCKPHISEKYIIPYQDSFNIKIDGNADNNEWNNSESPAFTFPWKNETDPNTLFYAKMDKNNFYFLFKVKDDDLVIVNSDAESDVAKGDRVELFFAQDKDLKKPYYCMEMSPNGKVLDYEASFYRKFDHSWNFPQIHIAASMNDTGYIVEGSIPVQVLDSLGIYKHGNKHPYLLAGLYRAAFSHSADNKIREEWVSWINPETKEPDFHVPSSFGSIVIDQ